MDKSIHVATSIQGLTFTMSHDGIWMNLSANGKHASINLQLMARDRNGVIGLAINEWCHQFIQAYRNEEITSEKQHD